MTITGSDGDIPAPDCAQITARIVGCFSRVLFPTSRHRNYFVDLEEACFANTNVMKTLGATTAPQTTGTEDFVASRFFCGPVKNAAFSTADRQVLRRRQEQGQNTHVAASAKHEFCLAGKLNREKNIEMQIMGFPLLLESGWA